MCGPRSIMNVFLSFFTFPLPASHPPGLNETDLLGTTAQEKKAQRSVGLPQIECKNYLVKSFFLRVCLPFLRATKYSFFFWHPQSMTLASKNQSCKLGKRFWIKCSHWFTVAFRRAQLASVASPQERTAGKPSCCYYGRLCENVTADARNKYFLVSFNANVEYQTLLLRYNVERNSRRASAEQEHWESNTPKVPLQLKL